MGNLEEQSWPQETARQWWRWLVLHPRTWLGNPHSPCSPHSCSSASCIRNWEGRFHSALSVWRNPLFPCVTSSGPSQALCAEGLPAYTEDRNTHKIQISLSFINQANSFHPTLSGNFPVSIHTHKHGAVSKPWWTWYCNLCFSQWKSLSASKLPETCCTDERGGIRAPATGTTQVAAIVL